MSRLMRDTIPLLSKSRFMAGLQCHKRLYLECYHRDLADPVDTGQQAIFDMGTRVGEVARGLYPNGVLVHEDHFHHDAAVSSTDMALGNTALPAVYEAAFLHDDVRMRVDLLRRADDRAFEFAEVKSSTRVKEEHLYDTGIQIYVLNGAVIDIRRVFVAHINKSYVYQGGDYDLDQLFTLEDVTDDVRRLQPEITDALREMRQPLWVSTPPDINTGRQCTQPYVCSFYGHCHAGLPEHHVGQLPRAREPLLNALASAGINDIRNIPQDFPGLNPTQRRVRDCVVNDRMYVDPQLSVELSSLEYPVHFLDFETFNPALPLYVGTRPYQVVPFQWSAHTMTRDGTLTHREYLHDGFDDPREAFAHNLLQALGTEGSIIVYSSFEATRIRELAEYLPHLSTGLLSLLDGRVVDLLQLVRKHCYHPEFHGSFSIKSVLPALVADLDYEGLNIKEGNAASAAYAEMQSRETSPERRAKLREDLAAYCHRDTEAEVRLLQVLSSMGDG